VLNKGREKGGEKGGEKRYSQKEEGFDFNGS
jgi:hypothetical protein